MMQSLDRTCDILDNVTYTLDAHIAIPRESVDLPKKMGKKFK